MTPTDWLMVFALGSVAGAAGQMARIAVGLKKAREREERFSGGKLVMSLAIGATAGSLAGMATLGDGAALASVRAAEVLGLIAAGYAGADFIEGVMARRLPGAPRPV